MLAKGGGSMKRYLLFAAIAVTTQLNAQISIDAGVQTKAPYTAVKVAYETTKFAPLDIEAAVRTDFKSVIPSLTGGFTTGAIRFMAGGFYHLKPETKDEPASATLLPGAAIRIEVNQGTIGVEWNGVAAVVTVGFVFRRTPR